MQKVYRLFASHILRPYYVWKLKKPVRYRNYGLDVVVEPGIFHPGYFYSTEFLLEHLQAQKLKEKTLLELGCGSGVISMAMAKAGAQVTAIDINEKAVTVLAENANRNQVSLEVLHSDQFSALANRTFDAIAINPPFYARDPKNRAEEAWFCGADFSYFTNLFAHLRSHVARGGNVWMVLSNGCDIARISEIARQNDYVLHKVEERRFKIEIQWVFSVQDLSMTITKPEIVS